MPEHTPLEQCHADGILLSLRAMSIVVTPSAESVPAALSGARVFPTVSAALLVALDGSTIHVLAGEYRENVVVEMNVAIVGYDAGGLAVNVGMDEAFDERVLRARIIGRSNSPVLTVKGCRASVSGLRLEHDSGVANVVELMGWTGRLEACSIGSRSSRETGMRAGIEVVGGEKGVIENCIVSGCERNGLYVRGAGEVHVKRCKLSGNGADGLRTGGSAKVWIEDCLLRGNSSCGMVVHDQSHVVARRCQMEANVRCGVSVDGDGKVWLVECGMLRNRGSGVITRGAGFVSADHCRIIGNCDYGADVFELPSKIQLMDCELGENTPGDRRRC